ncbi:tRNA (adenosine(37)-N6)-threonylcarbamoyltransferase complex transferase subunit TsaD [Geomonas sp. RF6]|uniref:tRNA (adenosine(37)-N6)-threonylcarbamoyltransferase complex transferase subunit TsaD n=1 Tax=Geomonas sp. RF6 TaxID=2897342 RepID=UPI001E5A31D1|nr:tRNA (adenosine(37)-N6)-threonylcarbamoyltransferase complex transferase subunit TsaD [Geomonas sp. RF6]UFS69858.1 tRNA (adenosine(37)-N6)-threonylcarbamoyltransferase complex transferase subunit TsaD [Geomonas sp. RF6]
MLLLALESSCDETAAAVVADGRVIRSNIVSSQIAVHAEYGGVVPEIASRQHLEAVSTVVTQALEGAGVTPADLKGIAVTQGPGLAGALLVGLSAAKGLAFGCGIPLIGVNHIEGHLLAVMLERPVEFPFLALAVSGGHSHLYRVDGVGRYRTLGQTVDDAAGEAFDKVAKLLGLPYPGGVAIDRLAAQGDPGAIRFPRPLLNDGSYNFSFSGLKTAVLTHVKKHPESAEAGIHDLAASFQWAVCDVLTQKTAAALVETGLNRLVVAGGVACNSALRLSMQKMCDEKGVELYIPTPRLCADNAAMIAVPGDFYLSAGISSGLDLDALPVWPLDRLAARLTEGM